jgi:protein-tyrosine phosphatase
VLILNLVDVDDPTYISPEIVDAALDAIVNNIQKIKVLLHCNQGQSRSPGIALLYLLKYTDLLGQKDMTAAIAAFRTIYPPYAPARGMAEYIRLNWHRHAQAASP